MTPLTIKMAHRRSVLSVAAAFLILLLTLGLLATTENTLWWFAYAATVTAAIASFIAFATRRLLFAGVTTLVLLTGILLVSRVKIATMTMSLHAYDIFFYTDLSTFNFLWSGYRGYVVAAIAFVAFALIVATLAWRFDGSRCPRVFSAAAFLLMVACVALFGTVTNGLVFELFERNSVSVSTYYRTWPAAIATIFGRQPFAASAHGALPRFAPQPACAPSTKPPNILLIHQESLVEPSLFPQLNYNHDLDRFFLSDDNRLHKLRVEVFGGASWITDFSIMAGDSSRFFGGIRVFLQVLLTGRLTEALPQILRTCGYRNVLFFPFDGSFVGLDKFYRSIGFDQVIDWKAQGTKTYYERDRVYFQNAMAMMEQHFRSSEQPLFTYVQTMTAHGPYTRQYMPEEDVAGGGPGTPPEMSEYLRRAAMVQRDGEALIEELKQRFPNERFVIIRFGDHQPVATRDYWPPDFRSSVDTSDAFITFYAIKGQNVVIPPLPAPDVVDVAYLGTIILDAASLPLTDAHRQRKLLMELCNGRYYGCERRDAIGDFHQRLIKSDIIQAR